MTPPFPANPAPAWYATTAFPAGHRAGIFFSGDALTFTLSQSGANAYQIRNLDGTVVASGAVSGTTISVGTAGSAPFDKYGWYRLYVTGTSSDSLFGTSYSSANFAIWRTNSNMVANGTDPGSPGIQGYGSAGTDQITRGMAVMGPQRWSVGDASNPTGSATVTSDCIAAIQGGLVQEKANYTQSSVADATRPRVSFCAFPNGGYDSLVIGSMRVYPKTEAVDGSTLTIKTVAGSTSGTKLTVTVGGSVVETYDNLASADAAVTATAGSTRIKCFGSGALTNGTNTTIGHAFYTGVSSAVATLYPDILYFEGPQNEPGAAGDEVAHGMRLFAAAVKAGNASAKTMGPNPVAFNDTSTSSFLQAFVNAGGATYCDAISVHGYNFATGADIVSARTALTGLTGLMSRNSLTAKPLWMTELGYHSAVYGVLHPRRMARWWMITYLMLEQYGIPKEHTFNFYDRSHGFWGFPSFWKFGGNAGSLDALVTTMRVFSEEVYGRPFASALSFGTPGDAMYCGSTYTNATDHTSVVAVIAQSSGLGPVTFTVTGATGSLTVSDAQGNTSTVTVTNGRVTVPVTDLPTYLRLPASASVTVYQHGNFPPVATTSLIHSSAGYGVTATTPGTTAATSSPTDTGGVAVINDGQWQNEYLSGRGPWKDLTGTLPQTLTLNFPTRVLVDHVVIWTGFGWQSHCTLTDFDVQTLASDGSTWVTQKTVTDIPTSFPFVADPNDSGCTRETYWTDRNVYDLTLTTPVATKGIRLNIRGVSSGGEPDENARAAGGQGWVPMAVVREIQCYADGLVTQPRGTLALTV